MFTKILSFLQINTKAAELLYSTAGDLAGLGSNGDNPMTLLDVCCGTGTIGLCLASRAKKVYGVELIEEAVKDANANARDNGVENALFCAGECNRDFPSMFVVKVMRDVCFL